MEISAILTQKVVIKPEEVLNKLRLQVLCGEPGSVVKDNDKFFVEVYRGSSLPYKSYITEEVYDTVKAIDKVLKYLNK